MDSEKDTPQKKSLIQCYWWVMFFFLLPFLTVGGYWGFLRWGHLLDDIGRDGGQMDAFHPEAIQAFFSGLFEFGTVPGLIGLAIAFTLIFLIRMIGKLRRPKSSGDASE